MAPRHGRPQTGRPHRFFPDLITSDHPTPASKAPMNFLSAIFNRKQPEQAKPAAPAAQPRLVKGYQIVYDDITRQKRDPGFEPLDNANSSEPAWYEYWPIRTYLNTAPLDESAVYGFVSPLFGAKTGLSAQNVTAFIQSSEDADVYAFSPFPSHGAAFLNVFEHSDFFIPGFTAHAAEFFRQFDPAIELPHLINHSGTTIYSNYFFAKPRFWRQWLAICGRLYQETQSAPQHYFNLVCDYAKEDGGVKTVPVKVFVAECVASYLLGRSTEFSCVSFPIQHMPMSNDHRHLRAETLLLDTLKREWQKTGRPEVLAHYRTEQKNMIAKAWPEQAALNSTQQT
jgi:hypothetical protein